MNQHHKVDTEELNATIIGLAIRLTFLDVIYPDRFHRTTQLDMVPVKPDIRSADVFQYEKEIR